MEGIYSPGKKSTIILSSLRPLGRRNFTCGHEIGHHIYGHGEQFDELRSEKNQQRKSDPNEFIADCFSGFLLMPKSAIDSGITKRKFLPSNLTAYQTYALSSWLGVGYKTLIQHMYYSLNSFNATKFDQLMRIEPKSIRESIFKPSAQSNLHIVDEHWTGRAVDCEVNDFLAVSKDTFLEGNNVAYEAETESYKIIKIQHPGIARLEIPEKNWAAFVRVSPQNFVGLSQYRHEEVVE